MIFLWFELTFFSEIVFMANKKTALELIFCYTSPMRIPQFIFLALVTAFATYFMNASLLAGDYLFAAVYAVFVGRNLYFSYKVTKFLHLVEKTTKKGD